jgi:hypothetical protein
MLEPKLRELRRGIPIIAHPLALNRERKLDEKRQRALTIYYLVSGAGGLAVGVHTTQFEIHNTVIYETLLKLTHDVVNSCKKRIGRDVFLVSGIVGNTNQALREAKMAYDIGYDAGLVSFHSLNEIHEDKLIEHIEKISKEIPVFGFYLQKSIGGLKLPYEFWRRLFERVRNIVGVKVAPFNRYATLDVIRALIDSERYNEIALYTGNDDNIIIDLLTKFKFVNNNGEKIDVRIVGGLLGHWAFWTKRSMEIFRLVKRLVNNETYIPWEILALNAQITDANGAIFDANNDFKEVIVGINEVLRRSGILEGIWTLNEEDELSVNHLSEIERIYRSYPHLRDDEFVKKYLDNWLEEECVGYDNSELSINEIKEWLN